MAVLVWEFYNCKHRHEMVLYPLGDIHIGNAACNEERLRKVVERIQAEDAYWVLLGDACDFIQRSDPRFDVEALAAWVQVEHLNDLVGAQLERLMEFFAPIAGRCLGVLRGNHELAILKHYERDVYSELIARLKRAAGWPPEKSLGLGDSGWLRLKFYREAGRAGASTIDIYLHHGFGGGRLAGAPALNLQRWLWTHEADLILMGHTHATTVQREAVERLDRNGQVQHHVRTGCYAGSFLERPAYGERKGYLPRPPGLLRVTLTPYRNPRVRVEVF